MEKEIKIKFSSEANKQYDELSLIVEGELKRGVKSSFHQSLLRAIDRNKNLLRRDPFLGDQVPKRLILKVYIEKYCVDNLWRIELPGRWRLLYNIVGNEVEVTSFILDFFDHKKYNRVFGYK